MNRHTLAGLFLLLGAALASGIWLMGSNVNDAATRLRTIGPEQTVIEWLSAARSGDVDRMIALTGSENLSEQIEADRDMIVRLVHETGDAGEDSLPGFDFRFDLLPERLHVDEDRATVVARLQRKGQRVVRSFNLTRRDGVWKIDGWSNRADPAANEP